VPDCWTHPAFQRHIHSKPESDIVVITHLSSSSTPNVATAEALGRLALGPAATATSMGMYPLSLRLPMCGPGQLALRDDGFLCGRLWPPPGAPAHIEIVQNIPVELRISGSRVKGIVRLAAEVFVGRTHETTREEETRYGTKKTVVPRSFLYRGDGRHVLLLQDPLRVQRFTARLMDRLIVFAYERQDLGLQVEHRTLTGRRLGRVGIARDDVEFAIRLPQPNETLRYIGDYAVP
jgi:hypothetical protein